MQELLSNKDGVYLTIAGYTGGDNQHPTYRNHPGHAEAVKITFDPMRITFRELLEFFFQVHDPTTLNKQGNDIGTSYRSAIFYQDASQREIAMATIKDIEASGRWPGPIVTEVTPASTFWEAEPEHQNYLIKNPGGYTCHFVRPEWALPSAHPAT
jgi:peptide-methionine (S)-S-oxide reductase